MTLTVVFEDGVFKPQGPVDLPEGTSMTILMMERTDAPGRAGGATNSKTRDQGSCSEVPASEPAKSPWDRNVMHLCGPVPDDFKELGEEWQEFLE